MNSLQQIREDAIRQGLLPADAAPAVTESRPWPVVLLTALGAWLAALPLIGFVGALLGGIITSGVGPYFAGALLLGAALVLLRSKDVPVFVEQIALPALLVGGGTLAFGLARDLPARGAAAVLLAIAFAVAWAVPRAWLRSLLGAAAAALAIFAAMPARAWQAHSAWTAFWVALHAVAAVWLAAMIVQPRLHEASRARIASWIESVGGGWIVVTLAGLACWSGMTFLVAGTFGGGLLRDTAREFGVRTVFDLWLVRIGSTAAAIAAMAVAARAWPSVRHPYAACVAVVLVALASLMPTLGATLLVLAWLATTRRWLPAGAAALAAAWIVGAFYYQLQWTLATKGLVLCAAGFVLAAAAWLAQRRVVDAAAAKPMAFERRAAALVGIGVVATLAFVNFSIWRNESLIAEGERIFVRLAPVDPRSLAQGDYMRLNFLLPDAAGDTGRGLVTLERPHVIMKRDARGVAEPLRIARAQDAASMAPGEIHVELTPADGRWTLVTDAWFFREGDAQHWQAARFAEFRVLPDGRALLVGLADEKLQPIAIR
jgi:uncharacterized membrane-anchored protein